MIVQDTVCLIVCAIAAVSDVRTYRIPNWLTLGGIVCGVALNAWLVPHGWLHAVSGALFSGIIFSMLGAIRFVGMGDVKLMTAVGALIGWPWAVYALAYVAFAGGIVAIAFALARGQLVAVFRNIGAFAGGVVKRGRSQTPAELHRIPYAVAILVGTALAVAARYVPFLRIG